MSSDDPLEVRASETRGFSGWRRLLWVSSCALVFVFLGVLLAAFTNHAVI
jgi:uncharacterized protein CbrC (UPF0167 family)